MKDLKSSDSEYYLGLGYDDLIASFEREVLLEKSDNDYQGDTLILLKHGDEYGVLEYGWGSCSGCDALEACDTIEQATELRDDLFASIKWASKDGTLEYLQSHDWEGSFWRVDTSKAFVAEALAILHNA